MRWAATIECADTHPLAHAITKAYTGTLIHNALGPNARKLESVEEYTQCVVPDPLEIALRQKIRRGSLVTDEPKAKRDLSFSAVLEARLG